MDDDKEESDDDEEESDDDDDQDESVNETPNMDTTPKKIVCDKCNKEFKFSIQKNKHKCEQMKKQFENIRIKQEIFENFQQQRKIKEEVFENYQDFQNFQEDDDYTLSPGLAAALSIESTPGPSLEESSAPR